MAGDSSGSNGTGSEEGANHSTEEGILLELGRVVEPLDEAVNQGPDGVVRVLEQMGIGELLLEEELSKVCTQLQNDIGDPLATVRSNLIEPLQNGEDLLFAEINFVEVAGAISDVFSGVRRLKNLQFEQVDPVEVGDRFVDFLLVSYLHDYHRATHNALALSGVIQNNEPTELDFTAIGALFSDPNAAMSTALDWGEQDFSGFLVSYYVHEILWRFQIPATLSEPPLGAVADLVEFDVKSDDLESEVRIPVLSAFEKNTSLNVGVRIVPTPGKEGTALPGLAIVPYGAANASETFDLGSGWTFNVQMSVDQVDWGLRTRPNDDGGLSADLVGTPAPSIDGEATLAFEGDGESSETTLLGKPDASRIGVNYAGLTAKISVDDGEVTITVALPARGTIGVHPSDFDGFLRKVMPGDGIFYDFDVTVGWSSESGLFFDRGGTLEVAIPQQAPIGPVSMEEIWLSAEQVSGDASETASGASAGEGTDGFTQASDSASVSTQEGTITIAGAATGAVELGPVTATVKRMGVEADVSFPEDGGNLGPVDMELGFKPPEGVGLSVDAGVVTGGGYLELDPGNERYAGVLQLKAGDLTINAVGLLTTELPGGKNGFSLLIIVSGEFPPVQLGFGFTLNGVGGLAGVNRSMKSKPLGKAIRTGSMDSLLFPEDPVANSQRIISDLRTIYPPTSEVYVFGPMARFGWGTPTLITGDLGVVLEIPTWKIALLGRMQTLLPDENAPLVDINLAVVGFLDPPNKSVSIDASLYDSRVLAWAISGDMALRSNWGENPRFVLSVGGWNPRFEPPNDFPELDRITATLGPPGGNPSLQYSGYFAVTSNTVQAGAGAHLLAEAGPARVEGKIAFDALVQFDPFKFIVDFLASLSVTIKSKGLSIRIDGTLSGPGPFRIRGKLTIEILLIKITARVDAKIGSGGNKEKLPPAQILPKLTEELGKPGNWSAQRPDSATGMVTTRDIETDDSTVLAHPMGAVGVRQTIVPLAFEIEKFGNATPAGYTKFTIEAATVGGSSLDLGDATTEQFAPAQYTKLSDQEELDSPAFESQQAGRRMRHDGLTLGYDDEQSKQETLRTATLSYETSIIDKTNDNWSTPLAELGRFYSDALDAISTMDEDRLAALADVSAVANARVRNVGVKRFRLDDETRTRYFDQLSGTAAAVVAEDAVGAAGAGDIAAEGTSTPASTVEGTSSATDGQQTVQRGGTTPDVGGLASSISMGEGSYVVASTTTMERVLIPTTDDEAGSKLSKQRALSRFAEDNPECAKELQVVAASKAKARAGTRKSGDETAIIEGMSQ